MISDPVNFTCNGTAGCALGGARLPRCDQNDDQSASIVGNDCDIEADTNSYSVPWRLIGERVAVTVAAGEVRVRYGATEVAVHQQAQGRRQRVIERAHLDGVAGRDGAVRQHVVEMPPIATAPPTLLRPLAEYEAVAGGSF